MVLVTAHLPPGWQRTVGQGAKGGIQQTTQRLIGVPPTTVLGRKTCNEVTGREQPIEIHRDDWGSSKKNVLFLLCFEKLNNVGWLDKKNHNLFTPKKMISW